MSIDHSHGSAGRRDTTRPWLIEILIVASLLGFGYFVVALDNTIWAGTTPGTIAAPPAADAEG